MPFTSVYTAPDRDKLPERKTDQQLLDLVRRQSEQRYDPILQGLPRQHETMQRQGMEAMGAMGLAGSGLGVRNAMIPIAQQNQRMVADTLREKGQFQQTAFDHLQNQERARADQLTSEDFSRWYQQQSLGQQQFANLAPYLYGTWSERQRLPLEWTGIMGEVPDDLNLGGTPISGTMQNVQSYVGDKGTYALSNVNGRNVVTINGLQIDVALVGGSMQNGVPMLPQWVIDAALGAGGGK